MIKMVDTKAKNIGIATKVPEKECKDAKCPYHGELRVRGRTFTGIVISDKMQNTATIEWPRKRFHPKYERFEAKRSRVKAHNPPCINARTGETVKIMETRPLSKTKNFVIVEKVLKKN